MNRKEREMSIREVENALNFLGGGSKVARLLNVWPQNVYIWKKKGKGHAPIPLHHSIRIDKLTKGYISKLKLRPDIFKD